MNKLIILVLFLNILPLFSFGQSGFTISGTVVCNHNNPLPGATVMLYPIQKGTMADANGNFTLTNIHKGKYEIVISFIGYDSHSDSISITENITHNATLQVCDKCHLEEVVVVDKYAETRKKEESLNIEVVNDEYLKKNMGGSLMKSLEKMPGVSTIDIGSGQSKPVIRGLGFNRVVVVENNIKHESQQWGADHGLEIDQFAAQNIEVIKGPASLQYGSDAIGGIIRIKNNDVPLENTLKAKADIIAKSNNNSIGSSISITGRKKVLFGSFRATVLSFGDYQVPADTVIIFPSTISYPVDLPNGRMRNTAGFEHNYHGMVGFVKNSFQNRTFASLVNSKGGLFANAQGMEAKNADVDLHDKSTRDIQMPNHTVSHFKLSNATQWKNARLKLETDLGYQYNFRQEWSTYISHGEMPVTFPDTLPFQSHIERGFEKHYYSAIVKAEYRANKHITASSGFNTNYQQNKINGRGFIIPAFQQFTAGGFLIGKYSFSEISVARIGARYDYGKINTDEYYDWYLSRIVKGTDTSYNHLQRANELSHGYSNISWSAGYNYTPANWIIKLNAGKSFRMPSPQELAANGVNYHYFRHEIGDNTLSPEVAWQLDAGAEYNGEKFTIGISPFVNYFSNYIYLNPTSQIEKGYQVFNYTQSKVFRYGSEIHALYKLHKNVEVGLVGDYVYSLQLSGEKKGYTLPYSPAPSAIINARYKKRNLGLAENTYVSVDYRLSASQNNIVPPEEITPSYTLINIGIGAEFLIKKQRLSVNMQIQNLLNAKYLNHTSFYRLMNVPEPGRNVIINVSIPFSLNKQTKD